MTNNELVNALDWMVRQELIAEIDATDGRCRYYRIASDDQFTVLLASAAPH